MDYLPKHLFEDPVRTSLDTLHARFAVSAKLARRYQHDVAPFATVLQRDEQGVQELGALLQRGEAVWVTDPEPLPSVAGLEWRTSLPCLQMALPAEVEPPPRSIDGIVPLFKENAAEMVALTDIAFPGFFRSRTSEMGVYFGVRSSEGDLIAMAGERLQIPGYPEVSGVCTHPDHRGKGLAAELMWTVIRGHRTAGVQSWLHVTSANSKAISLYERMGFVTVREVILRNLVRL